MHAFLIVGGSEQKRENILQEKLHEWKIDALDTVELSGDGIEDIRKFQSRLLLKPFRSLFTAGIVRQAETLTLPAQQAILKTLEEPPASSRIILETPNENLLLPTIISRCIVVSAGNPNEYIREDMEQCLKTLQELEKSPIGQKFAIIDSIATTREDAEHWVSLAIATSRLSLIKGNFETSVLIKKLLKAREELSVNVNPKLVLDNIFLPE